MVDSPHLPTFLGGRGETRKEELELHNVLQDNIDKYAQSEESLAVLFHNKYDLAHSPGVVMQRLALGNGKVRILNKKVEALESITQDNMYTYFALLGQKRDLNDAMAVIEKQAEREKKIRELKASAKKFTENAINAARTITQYSFYFYMFFGVQNLLGLDADFLNLSLPYKPDIIIGTMPFYSAQKLERGMSDRALKYRAIGDIFLAHQRGSTDTLRVDMTLFGPYRGWYLLYLLSLQQVGESKLKQLPLIANGPKVSGEELPSERLKLPKKGKVQFESHTTFPIITQTAFMLDMFLQTIEWHQEQDDGGHDFTFVHLLFRKHIDPIGYTIAFDKNTKVGYTHYGETATQRRRKELLVDTIWKVKEIGVEVLNQGLFGGSNMEVLDREAIMSDPYVTDIAKLLGGYSYDINNMASIIPGLGG